MYKYKNETDQDMAIVGKGVVQAGQVVESKSPIENPNLTLIEAPKNGAIVGTEHTQPNAVTDATPVAPTAKPEENK